MQSKTYDNNSTKDKNLGVSGIILLRSPHIVISLKVTQLYMLIIKPYT